LAAVAGEVTGVHEALQDSPVGDHTLQAVPLLAVEEARRPGVSAGALPVVDAVARPDVVGQRDAHRLLRGADRLLAGAGPEAGEHPRRVRREPDVDAVPDTLHAPPSRVVGPAAEPRVVVPAA